MSVAYITVDEAKDLIPEIVESDENPGKYTAVENFIDAASGFIDRYCLRPPGYFLPAADDPTDRIYRGQNKNYLQIGRHVPGSVTVRGIATAAFYESAQGWLYVVDPSAASNDQEFFPDDVYRVSHFWQSCRQYTVNARWGFLATPDEIKHACKAIVEQIYDRGEGTIGTVSPSGFVIERDIPLTAKVFLKNWIRRDFEVN